MMRISNPAANSYKENLQSRPKCAMLHSSSHRN